MTQDCLSEDLRLLLKPEHQREWLPLPPSFSGRMVD